MTPEGAHGHGCRCHCEGCRQFTRCFGGKITIASQNSVECLTRIAPAADQDRSKRVHLEAELRCHSEIAAAPANAPEQFRLNVQTRMQCATLGSDEVHAQQVVDRQTKAPAQPSHAATQREPCNPCVRNDSSRRYKSNSGACDIQMPKQCTSDPKASTLRAIQTALESPRAKCLRCDRQRFQALQQWIGVSSH